MRDDAHGKAAERAGDREDGRIDQGDLRGEQGRNREKLPRVVGDAAQDGRGDRRERPAAHGERHDGP